MPIRGKGKLWSGIGLGLAVSMLSAAAQQPTLRPSERVEAQWFKIDTALVAELQTADIGMLAKSLEAAPPARDPAVLMRRLDVALRACRRKQAEALIARLAKVAPPPNSQDLRTIADTLIGHEEWDLARQFLTLIPQAEPGWGEVFVRHWAEKGDPAVVDRWLASRADANPRYWTHLRLEFRQKLGTAGPLLQTMAADVRAHPQDLNRAESYIEAAGKSADLGLIRTVCKLRLAVENLALGQSLSSLSPQTASLFFERSLAMPFTSADWQWLRQHWQQNAMALPALREGEKWIRAQTKLALAQSYQAAGQSAKAQPLLEQITAANAQGLPVGLGQFAGQVQAGSGARVIENRILKAEPKDTSSYEYWLTRADYYFGRKENAEAVKAYEKACTLAAGVTGDEEFAHIYAMSQYTHYLFVTGDAGQAVRRLRQELQTASLDGKYAAYLITDMLYYERDDTHFLKPDDARLWAFLAARKQWSYPEEKLLWRMAQNAAAGPERDRVWAQAEKLTAGADPMRAKTLGWIMTRTVATKRALPLLQAAVRRLPDGEDRNTARFTLLEAYLALNAWKQAEALWPEAQKQLTPTELPNWYSTLAVAAAKAGATDEALRLWRAAVNFDRSLSDKSYVRNLQTLADLGLKPRLQAFYRRMAHDDPESHAPQDALALLR